MDTKLLSAQLYSGSKSPGGGPYQFTAPMQPTQAASLVAAFNGGFLMKYGGGRLLHGGPRRRSARDRRGLARDLRRRLGHGRGLGHRRDHDAQRRRRAPEPGPARRPVVSPRRKRRARTGRPGAATCGATSCASSGPGHREPVAFERRRHRRRRARVRVGPGLTPLQLADLLARAGVVRGMELDINPSWPVFATYAPAPPTGPRGAGEREQPAAEQRAGPVDLLRPGLGPRLRDHVGPGGTPRPAERPPARASGPQCRP